MLSAYPACFFKEENGYSVIFPDLNHLATCGETLDEALAMAVDCLAGYLYWMEEDGESAPPPSSINCRRTRLGCFFRRIFCEYYYCRCCRIREDSF